MDTQEIFKKQYEIGEILRDSWQKFVENFQIIMMISLLINLPVTLFIHYGFTDKGFLFFLLIICTRILVLSIAFCAIALVTKAAFEGRQLSLDEALKLSLKKWPLLIATRIMLSVFLMGLTVLLIVPGIIFGVYWAFSIMAVIFENQRPYESLQYSKRLVQGRWWDVCNYTVFFVFISSLLAMLVNFSISLLSMLAYTSVLFDVLGDIILSIVMPFFVVVSTVFYLNFNATKIHPSIRGKQS